ncbi:MAG: metalloregulator ArsR/SmtB family transcription factor, partial [Cyanobacteria bacterium J06659_2]
LPYFDSHRNMEANPASQKSIDDIAAAFAALGQPSRLKIVRLLLSAYPKGLPAGEIQKELGIAAPTLSHHLDKLRQVGIVAAEKDRQWIWYNVRSEALKHLIDFLFEECCTRNRVIDIEDMEFADTPDTKDNNSPCCD